VRLASSNSSSEDVTQQQGSARDRNLPLKQKIQNDLHPINKWKKLTKKKVLSLYLLTTRVYVEEGFIAVNVILTYVLESIHTFVKVAMDQYATIAQIGWKLALTAITKKQKTL
jgi:hypothetical protein